MSSLGDFIGISQYQQSTPMAMAIDEYDSNTIYVGIAEIGSDTSEAKWQIKRLLKTGTETLTTWADGDALRDNVWDNHLILTYL